jgi:beta-lactamase class A
MFLRSCLLAIGGALLILPASPLLAQTPTEVPATATPLEAGARTLVTVLDATAVAEDAFTAALLAQVPYAQISAIAGSLTEQYGPPTGIEAIAPVNPTAGLVTIRLERARIIFKVSVDPADGNRMNGLFVQEVIPIGDTPEKIAADLAALPGSVNAWFGPLDGDAPVISLSPDTPLALGSTFKLYVLATLAEEVRAGRRKWTDIVPLTEKSYPSGQLQNWPKGAPLTLHTLAGLMISISDNTATDQLIELLGRERIARVMRETGTTDRDENAPFLKTRELFMLKGGDAAQLAAYRAGDTAQRTRILASLKQQEVTLDQVNAAFAAGPKALDIEWFASPRDLSGLLARLRDRGDDTARAIIAINPSATPAIRANWDYIGFKGGSEPGVLNLTWLLRDKAGAWHVLTLGWNNPAASLDQAALEGIAQRILLLPR